MKRIDSQYHFTLEDIKKVMCESYFDPSRFRGQINRGTEICEKYALQELWFIREIKYGEFVWSQASVREFLMNEMTVSDLDSAEHHVKTQSGCGRHRIVAKVLFFFLVFGEDLWDRHYREEITGDDIVKEIYDFIEKSEFKFGEGSFGTEVLEYGHEQN